MNKSKKIIVFFFVFIIFCPILLAFFHFATGIKLDATLNGYFDAVDAPELTMSSYIDGEYQPEYEEWLNDSLLPRALYTKIYNQIEYSCFDLGSRVIGKQNNIFEREYVEDALALDEFNYALPDKQAELTAYAEHLVNIQNKLQKYNKHLVVYFTPSKAVSEVQDIPASYKARQTSDSIRAIEYLQTLLDQTDVPYLDSHDLLDTHRYPPFYSTGIHWARPIEQETSIALIDLLKEVSGKDLRNIELTSINTSNQPFWRDTDVYDLLNVFSPYPDLTYYEYGTKRQYPDVYEEANILLQGGSFAQGFLKDYSELYTNDNISYINYGYYVMDEFGRTQTLDAWTDLDLGAYLDQADFVVIELQEAAIVKYSSGFAAYLDEYLDSYIPGKTASETYSANLDGSEQTGLEHSKGYFSFEDGYAWTKQCSSVTLENNNLATKGMTIELTVPEYILYDGETTLNVYVNKQKIDTLSVSAPGTLTLDYDSDIFADNTDIYEIEIYCDSSFFPKEIGLNDDSRELSLLIHYIGEKR